jgi:outer membrane protein
MKYWPLILPLLATTTPLFANENRGDARERVEPMGYLYGFGLGVSQEIYKGYDYRVIPLPILGYRGENFRVLGPFVSYDALQLGDVEVELKISPRFQGFDETDSEIFTNMDKRKFSMDAGVGFTYERNNWKLGFSSMFDILSNSKGFETSANISRVFRQGPIFIEPSVRVSYLDENHVDYYYGVKPYEVNELTYHYQGSPAVNTSLGLSVGTPILLGGFTQVAIDYTLYDSAITNSPLVEDSHNLNMRLLFSKFF